MPYFVHLKGVEPTFGTPFDLRADAHRAQGVAGTGYVVTLKLSEDETHNWTWRERERFINDEYQKTPWHSEALDRAAVKGAERREMVYRHFVHLSKRQPGMLAYTPDEDYGYQDRQVQIKPGKYLELLSDLFTPAEIADYVARVKAYGESFKLATSEEDIISVYLNGPNSCMSHSLDNYRSHVHPTAVYADSDLAVAYLGNVKDVSARCVVWPDRKLYSRVYGDETLAEQLKRDGWKHSYYLSGARIRAIQNNRRGSYVMPYVDCADSADLDGQWFVLSGCEDGEYRVKETDGTTSENARYFCENCDERISEDDGQYCESCRDDLHSCDRCGHESFDSDDFRYIEHVGYYCDSCAERYRVDCPVCEDTRYERLPDTQLCTRCERHHAECPQCDEYYDTRNGVGTDENGDDCCMDCHHEDEDEDTPTRPEPETPFTPVADMHDGPTNAVMPYPTPFVRVTARADNQRYPVAAITRRGCLVLHNAYASDDGGYTITHEPTGLVVLTLRSESAAHEALRRLYRDGSVDWTFTVPFDGVPTATREHALNVRATYRQNGELLS